MFSFFLRWFNKPKPPSCLDCRFHLKVSTSYNKHFCRHPKIAVPKRDWQGGVDKIPLVRTIDARRGACGKMGKFFKVR